MWGLVAVELAQTDRGDANALKPSALPKEEATEALDGRDDNAVESEGRGRVTTPRGVSGSRS
jgi:hypothetical protein